MIQTVVVGHGLAGRAFHCPLIRRQFELNLHGIVARDPRVRAEAVELWQVRGYASLDEALDDPKIQLVVIATPHNTHAELAVRALEAGRHCVVDKVMALTTEQADAMIAARDRSGRMLSVFHNRRWDWDFVTIMALAASEVVLIRATFAASPSSSAVSGPSADGPGLPRRSDPNRPDWTPPGRWRRQHPATPAGRRMSRGWVRALRAERPEPRSRRGRRDVQGLH